MKSTLSLITARQLGLVFFATLFITSCTKIEKIEAPPTPATNQVANKNFIDFSNPIFVQNRKNPDAPLQGAEQRINRVDSTGNPDYSDEQPIILGNQVDQPLYPGKHGSGL